MRGLVDDRGVTYWWDGYYLIHNNMIQYLKKQHGIVGIEKGWWFIDERNGTFTLMSQIGAFGMPGREKGAQDYDRLMNLANHYRVKLDESS